MILVLLDSKCVMLFSVFMINNNSCISSFTDYDRLQFCEKDLQKKYATLVSVTCGSAGIFEGFIFLLFCGP